MPEYAFLDPRGMGIFDGKEVATVLPEVYDCILWWGGCSLVLACSSSSSSMIVVVVVVVTLAVAAAAVVVVAVLADTRDDGNVGLLAAVREQAAPQGAPLAPKPL